jgi:hypothetical protein
MTMQQPRNVMLHRMRSGAGRGLNDKYRVDWKTVIGEGAYGSVHPARLAATGEKVSLVRSNSDACPCQPWFLPSKKTVVGAFFLAGGRFGLHS